MIRGSGRSPILWIRASAVCLLVALCAPLAALAFFAPDREPVCRMACARSKNCCCRPAQTDFSADGWRAGKCPSGCRQPALPMPFVLEDVARDVREGNRLPVAGRVACGACPVLSAPLTPAQQQRPPPSAS